LLLVVMPLPATEAGSLAQRWRDLTQRESIVPLHCHAWTGDWQRGKGAKERSGAVYCSLPSTRGAKESDKFADRPGERHTPQKKQAAESQRHLLALPQPCSVSLDHISSRELISRRLG